MSDVKANVTAAPVRRDLRTPLARARGLGSGKSGTSHFWWIRVTAVVLALLVPWLVGLLVSMIGADLDSVRETIARPWNAILLTLFAVSMFWHTRMGLQTIIEDYIQTRSLEIALQFLAIVVCTLGALASLYAIARIALL